MSLYFQALVELKVREGSDLRVNGIIGAFTSIVGRAASETEFLSGLPKFLLTTDFELIECTEVWEVARRSDVGGEIAQDNFDYLDRYPYVFGTIHTYRRHDA